MKYFSVLFVPRNENEAQGEKIWHGRGDLKGITGCPEEADRKWFPEVFPSIEIVWDQWINVTGNYFGGDYCFFSVGNFLE